MKTIIQVVQHLRPGGIEIIALDLLDFSQKDERTIILTVSPGNADISTSEGLHMARQIDPKGDRTIGVITKVIIIF